MSLRKRPPRLSRALRVSVPPRGRRDGGPSPSQWPRQRGFTLLESVIAVMLVGLLMVAALQSVGAAKRREIHSLDQLQGQQLAAALMNEILLQAYSEPVTAAVFGPESGEAGNRTLFDDVDDYSGWSATPPTDRSGQPVPGFSGWTHSVAVQWADPTTLTTTPSSHTGLKRLTATVSKGNKTIATVTGYRSIGWMDTIPTPDQATSNHPPVAVATSPDLTRSVGQSVSFSGSTSSDPDGDYVSCVWNFGNGSTATGPSARTTYSAAGTYTCTLTVYDGKGGVATASLTVVISP